jgi:multidrug efflux pump subunit AcrA (membrane-fusion protein)
MFWLVGVAVIVLVCLLAMGILPRISRNAALAQRTKQVKSSVPAVVVVRPKLVPDSGISLPGNVEAIKETTIGPRTTGYLRQLYVDIGSRVKAGQVLALIAAPDTDQQLAQAVAQTNQSRAVVTQSVATVAQQQATVAQDQADVDKQRATVEQARAQLESTEAAVKQAQASEEGSESALLHAQQALAQQNANLKQQQATLNLNQTTYNRYKDLVAQGFDSQQDLDQALANVKTQQAVVASAQAAIQSAEADVTTAQKAVLAAQAAVSAAKSNVTAAQKNVKLNQDALVSAQATVRSAIAAVHASQATVQANVAGVASNQANQQRYAVLQGFEKITAPFDGIVTSRTVDGALLVGDSASGTTPTASAVVSNSSTAVSGSGMLGLARTDEVRIQVSVPQAFVPSLRAGSDAAVTIRELPGQTFNGTVTLRSGAMDTTSRTQLVEVHLKNPAGIMVPGMYATVNITPVHPPMTLQVPGTALIVDANGTRVGVVDATNTVHMQPVVIGRDFGTTVEILSGLKGRERLVNNPSDLLQDGDKVQITKAAARRGGRGGAGGAGAAGRGGAEGAGSEGGGAPGGRGAESRAPGSAGASGSDTGGAPGGAGSSGSDAGSGAAGSTGASSGDTGSGAAGGSGAPGSGHHRHRRGAGAPGGAPDGGAGQGGSGGTGSSGGQ